jgi:hypothetical protein
VVGHVLEEVDRTLARAEDDLSHHPPAVAVHRLKDLAGAGVIRARRPQVVAVQGLVHHHGVGALPEGVHERRRDVARPRPHRELEAFGHARPGLPRGRLGDGLGVQLREAGRERAAFAGADLRPSTSTTGVRPPKVPVTNASSAPYTSVREKARSETGMPSARQSATTVRRVMPFRE